MSKKNAINNPFLKEARSKTSQQVYNLILELVNEDRQELADTVLKVDYLIDYANTCARQKAFKEAKEVLEKAKSRIVKLKGEGVDTEYLQFIYEGVEKKL